MPLVAPPAMQRWAAIAAAADSFCCAYLPNGYMFRACVRLTGATPHADTYMKRGFSRKSTARAELGLRVPLGASSGIFFFP